MQFLLQASRLFQKKIEDFLKKILQEFKRLGMPDNNLKTLFHSEKNSCSYSCMGSKDNYKETRSFPKYNV